MINKEIISDKRTEKIIILFFILALLSDFLMKLITYGGFDFYFRFSGIIKLLFEIFLILVLIKKGLNKYFIYLLLTLIISFFIGQLFLKTNTIFDRNLLTEILKGDIYHLNKYVFIILFVALVNSITNKIDTAKSVIKSLLILLFINSIFVIVGFVFEINYLKSFPNSSRFGFSGLFSKSGEAVLLYSLACIYFYLKSKNLFPVVYYLIIMFLSGKKISLLFGVFFFIVHFCIMSEYRQYFRFLGLLILASVFYFKDIFIKWVLVLFPFWNNIIEQHGFLAAVTSTRSLAIQRTINYINENWLPINYIFGGTNYNILKVELDPIDLFIFFGFIGAFSYLYFIKKYFIDSIFNTLVKLMVICYIIIGMVYGAFLFNILLMTITYLFIVYFSSLKINLNE